MKHFASNKDLPEIGHGIEYSKWFRKAENSDRKLINQLKKRGWSKEQLEQDALNVWRDSNRLFFSINKSAKVDINDVISSIKEIFPESKIDWNCEARPGNWIKIL